MQQKLSFRLGNFLYLYAYWLYQPLYFAFKRRTDAYEIKLMRDLISEGSKIIDIGSNIGFYTRILSKLTGAQGKVISFEADKQNFKHLTNDLSGFKNVVFNNTAVSDKEGSITIYTSHRLNVDNRTYKPEKYKSEYQVNCTSLDEYLKDKPDVDFIKMDIQGAEFMALKGMNTILNENERMVLLTELSPHFLMLCSGTSVSEFTDNLISYNFTLYLIRNEKLVPFKVDLIKTNAEKDYFENMIAIKGDHIDIEKYL